MFYRGRSPHPDLDSDLAQIYLMESIDMLNVSYDTFGLHVMSCGLTI